MILCVSLNPAIDRRLRVDTLKIGAVTRARSSEDFAGGKATHVALVARTLGAETAWIGFLGGTTGAEVQVGLTQAGVAVAAVHTKSSTRTNLEILDAAGQSTEVLEPGGAVDEAELEELAGACRKFYQRAKGGLQVVFSGSLTRGVPPDFYARLIREAHEAGVKALLDASGDALVKALPANPDMVKPNRHEAEAAAKMTVRQTMDALEAARRLMVYGARSVALSLGVEGLLWCGPDGSAPLLALAPEIKKASTVGCGDATVAAFAVATERGLPREEGIRLAAASGAANCLASSPGMVKREDVERILPTVNVRAV